MGRKGKHPPVKGTPKVDRRSKVRRERWAILNEGQRDKGQKKTNSLNNSQRFLFLDKGK